MKTIEVIEKMSSISYKVENLNNLIKRIDELSPDDKATLLYVGGSHTNPLQVSYLTSDRKKELLIVIRRLAEANLIEIQEYADGILKEHALTLDRG